MKIWKFRLDAERRASIEMPKESKILCLQMQEGWPHLWALVDESNSYERRTFEICGTGWALDEDIDSKNYIGTYQPGNGLVFHVFEIVK